MDASILKIVFLLGIVIEMVIRAPLRQQTKNNTITDDRVSRQERILLGFLFLTMFLLPVIYIFTPWLNFADYTLPAWAGWLGIGLMIVALLIFWRAHADLGLNWSPSLQIRSEHTLITQGIYHWIRHPMYASQWVWVIAQALLLQNWLAGPVCALAFLPLYLLRVPREEKMMLDSFGDQYRQYMNQTGRVFPKLG